MFRHQNPFHCQLLLCVEISSLRTGSQSVPFTPVLLAQLLISLRHIPPKRGAIKYVETLFSLHDGAPVAILATSSIPLTSLFGTESSGTRGL